VNRRPPAASGFVIFGIAALLAVIDAAAGTPGHWVVVLFLLAIGAAIVVADSK
jgi:hypothetical protein